MKFPQGEEGSKDLRRGKHEESTKVMGQWTVAPGEHWGFGHRGVSQRPEGGSQKVTKTENSGVWPWQWVAGVRGKERSLKGRSSRNREAGVLEGSSTWLLKSSQIKTEIVLDRQTADMTSPVGERVLEYKPQQGRGMENTVRWHKIQTNVFSGWKKNGPEEEMRKQRRKRSDPVRALRGRDADRAWFCWWLGTGLSEFGEVGKERYMW